MVNCWHVKCVVRHSGVNTNTADSYVSCSDGFGYSREGSEASERLPLHGKSVRGVAGDVGRARAGGSGLGRETLTSWLIVGVTCLLVCASY